ncbi:hypothetical protein N7465_001693, partial [Penicillium sp. CMV-2018d]
YCWHSGLNPFWKSHSWQSIFNTSAIFYGIAIVKNTAPEQPQPQSTYMIAPMVNRASHNEISAYQLSSINFDLPS